MSQCSTAKFCQHIFILKQTTTSGKRIYLTSNIDTCDKIT